jgi:hypothetical protein
MFIESGRPVDESHVKSDFFFGNKLMAVVLREIGDGQHS